MRIWFENYEGSKGIPFFFGEKIPKRTACVFTRIYLPDLFYLRTATRKFPSIRWRLSVVGFRWSSWWAQLIIVSLPNICTRNEMYNYVYAIKDSRDKNPREIHVKNSRVYMSIRTKCSKRFRWGSVYSLQTETNSRRYVNVAVDL